MVLNGIWHVLTRRKVLDAVSVHETKLKKCLGTGDLTALGVGSTLGIGIYVLAGHVAKETAGPSVVVSFLLAAVASVFAGLCYAEFGARVPRAGSAYVYSYVCVGEFIAFIIGWNLILEYAIGSASVSRGVSLYLDSILNNTLKETFREIAPIHLTVTSDYFDLFAFGLTCVVGFTLAFGLSYSAIINNIFTVLNICIVIFIIASGAFKADIYNWFISKDNIPQEHVEDAGNGGFYPFGFAGTLKGAATCFFGFVGFDCIATTGEEVKNPKKSIPLSIILSLAIIFLSYFGVSAIVTLMCPYYLQDSNSPIPFAFEYVGWGWAKWIVAIGGIFGMLASLFGAMYPLPRILYAMASDGLIFRFLGIVSQKYKSPIIGTIIASLLTGTMAGLFELQHLINMMSIGTLMAYTIVAACIVLLRYNHNPIISGTEESYTLLPVSESDEETDDDNITNTDDKEVYEEDLLMDATVIGSLQRLNSTNLISKPSPYTSSDVFKQLFNGNNHINPTRLSSCIVGVLITLYCIFSLCCGLCISYMWTELLDGSILSIVLTSIFGGLMLITFVFVAFQPRSNSVLSFQVPWVPLIPFISIFINIYLMLMLDENTWIRFGIWMAIGIPVYLLSLWVYNRGTNYDTYVQKSSMNGTLNYGTEQDECKELPASFDDSDSGIKTDLSTEKQDFNENLEIANQNLFPVNHATLDDNENSSLTECEQKEDLTANEMKIDYGEEIELLDKVLQEAEDASNGSLYDYAETAKPMDITETFQVPFDVTESFQDSDSKSIDNVLNRNVIVLVHREDEENPVDDVDKLNKLNEPTGDILDKSEEFNASLENNETLIIGVNSMNITEIEIKPDDAKVSESKSVIEDKILIPIPPPPPLDSDSFNSPKPFVKNKSYRAEKKNDTIHIDVKNEIKPNVEENDLDIPREAFLSKLNNLYGQQTLHRGLSINPSMGNYRAMHKSEPDLQALFKKEPLSIAASNIVPVEINESRNQNSSPPDKPNETNATEPGVLEEVAPSKDEIKKKLESIFAKSPVALRAKVVKVNDTKDEIKPKVKNIDFTNTMKIQRARFNDVLKSFEEAGRRSSEINDVQSGDMKNNQVLNDNVSAT